MFLTDIGYGRTGLTGLGIIFIDARFLLAPGAAAAGFGLAIGTAGTTTNAYLSVKGVRDIASGVIAFILVANGVPHLLGWFMLAASIIPFGDAITVLRHNGPKATAYGVHAATAAVMLAVRQQPNGQICAPWSPCHSSGGGGQLLVRRGGHAR
jgi:hypothetical protein